MAAKSTPRYRRFAALCLLGLGIALSPGPASLADDLDRFAEHDPNSRAAIDYSPVDVFLERFVQRSGARSKVYYEEIEQIARPFVVEVLRYLRRAPIEQLNKDEQLALWLNLYLFESVRQTLAADIPRSAEDVVTGEDWSRKTVGVDDVRLSLGDIETLLQRHWGDPLILYGLATPAKDAPAYPEKAFRGATVWQQLEELARDYVDASHGLKVRRGTAQVSPHILTRKAEWFDDNEAELLTHLAGLADERASEKLQAVDTVEARKFRWRLNGAKRPARSNLSAGAIGGGGGGGGNFGS
ncbi:MAG: DUF547 domain-containing protein [Rhodothalassiaceae bacterium]